jgi:hypothetical protein
MDNSYLVSSLSPTRGFHPTSTSTIYFAGSSSQSTANAYSSCHIYLYYNLPSLVYIDTHELAQRSKHYGYTYWGTRDLEKPVYALPPEESSGEVLVRVKVPEQLWEHRIPDDRWEWEDEMEPGQGGGWKVTVEVPMHLRYGTPRATRSSGEAGSSSSRKPYEEVRVDWPQAFLLCPSSSMFLTHYLFTLSHQTLASLRSHYTQPHGTLPAHVFEALPTGPRQTTVIIPIAPHSNYTKSASSAANTTSPPPSQSTSSTSDTLLLPVGDPSDLAFVEPLTALTILICFVWLWRVSWKVAGRLNGAMSTPVYREKHD